MNLSGVTEEELQAGRRWEVKNLWLIGQIDEETGKPVILSSKPILKLSRLERKIGELRKEHPTVDFRIIVATVYPEDMSGAYQRVLEARKERDRAERAAPRKTPAQRPRKRLKKG